MIYKNKKRSDKVEKYYFEVPSIKRKKDAIDYINEFYKYKSEINGTGGLQHILEDISYEEWLIKNEKLRDKKYAYSLNKCPAETFFLIRENDNKIVGMINIRHELNEYMKNFGGHIGYGIRPTERRKGYNKINLYLGLCKAKELYGLDSVMLDCDVDNIASNKTIIALGGKLERQDTGPYDNKPVNIYWIDVNKSLEKYKDIYIPYIIQ